jgi:hypothetical protein
MMLKSELIEALNKVEGDPEVFINARPIMIVVDDPFSPEVNIIDTVDCFDSDGDSLDLGLPGRRVLWIDGDEGEISEDGEVTVRWDE